MRTVRATADSYLASPVVRAQADSVAALLAVLALDALFGFPTAFRLGYVFPICVAARGAGLRWSVGVVFAAALILTTIEWYLHKGQVNSLASLALHACLLGLILRLMERLESGLANYQTLACQDALTGLPNRNALQRLADKAIQRAETAKDAQGPLTLAMIDCDRFKELNDTYGHAYGDLVLKLLARTLGHGLRRHGWVARTGGDEFVALLPGCTPENAAKLLIESRTRFLEAGVPGTGFTFGVAQWRPGASLDSLLADADRAMYRHKPYAAIRTSSPSRATPSA
ncbi:MAG: GGDEF domain-containing protein [Chthonomonadaceae bacterium]|nr:GGDEF domain-containing protein [Chthonomonadaceae bacterium]